MKDIYLILKEAVLAGQRNNLVILAAALSFFTVFSIVPILILTIALMGHFLGAAEAKTALITQASHVLSPEIAQTLNTFVEMGQQPGAGLASFFSFVILFFTASKVFIQLQKALNVIWGVKVAKKGFVQTLKSRLTSFSILLGIGGGVSLILVFDTILRLALQTMVQHFPQLSDALMTIKKLNIVSFLMLGLASASIYKFLPEKKIAWKDVWPGGLLTAFLFFFGRSLLILYFKHSSFGNLYGAASSLLILFMWVFYSSQIFLFGAELSRSYSDHKKACRSS